MLQVKKINFVVALKSEAKPLIDYFGLTLNTSKNPSSDIYSNLEKKIHLIISGIGVNNAKKAITNLNNLEHDKNSLWVNIGLAGHRSYEIGSIYEVKKVVYKKCKDPIFTNSFYNNFQTSALCCVDLEEKEFNREYLYDMESFGFLHALDSLTLKENIFIFKIVSDNLYYKPKNYKSFAIINIKKNIIKIDKTLTKYRFKTLHEKFNIKIILNIIKQKYHITFYNEKKLEKILTRTSALKNKEEIEKEIEKSKSLSELIKQFEDILSKYIFKI